MSRFRALKAGTAAVLLASVVLAGCVVTPVGPPRYYGGATVTVAPPPVREEVIGIAPGPGYIWMGGYWNWVGGRHVWVGGHWGPGRAGYHWVPHRWVPYGGGYRMVQGHWER